jgi:uncharacterized protein YjlB
MACHDERRSMPERSATEEMWLADDGLVPNNAALSLRLYRGALAEAAANPGSRRAEAAIIEHFARNGWGGAWIDGVYPFHHYHARSHEVLGLARGRVDVQFGGLHGPIVRLEAGDAVLIPAGVGHCCKQASPDLSVVGAYPAGQEDWDMKRATPAARAIALGEIPFVELPLHDPVFGGDPPWPRA